MRRAEEALDSAMGQRDWHAAERYYQSAVENAQAITDPALRARLTRGLAMSRVCLLAQRGDAEEAEQFAAPIGGQLRHRVRPDRKIDPGPKLLFGRAASFAQRQNERYAEAVRTAQTIIERCRATKRSALMACEARPLREMALAELGWGRNVEAMATMQECLKSARKLDNDPNTALAYGRALLANGRAQEALEPLRMAYGAWLSSNQPGGVFAAEVEYWFGQAWIAHGEVKRGRWMMAEARRVLAKSALPSHRCARGTAGAVNHRPS